MKIFKLYPKSPRILSQKLPSIIGLILLNIFILSFNNTPANANEDYMNSENNKNVDTATATFAGGCFWCMQPVFDNLKGVLSTSVGYTGGSAETANYKTVSTGRTLHVEAINVVYDPKIISFQKLLDEFLKNVDPTDPAGQFADKGPQYESAVFYHNNEQKTYAEQKFAETKKLPQFKDRFYTKVLPFASFYDAESEHQKYYQKNAMQYNAYKYGSGRPAKLKDLWSEEK